MSASGFSPEAPPIPPKSFYSGCQISPKLNTTHKENIRKSHVTVVSPKTSRRYNKFSINKGVHHKIRPQKSYTNNNLRRQMRTLDVNSILDNIQNEELRNRIENNRAERQQIEKIHKIFRYSQNPIELARPLRALNMTENTSYDQVDQDIMFHSLNRSSDTQVEFSDLDSSSDESVTTKATHNEEESIFPTQLDKNKNTIIPSVRSQTPNENRKFFKTGETANIPKEVKITENIKALVCNGKISLISDKRNPFRKHGNSNAAVFSDAKAAVDVIIKNFDSTDSIKSEKGVTRTFERKENILHKSKIEMGSEIELTNHNNYITFRKRIPCGTDDPNRIDAQNSILNILIANNICNEETFKIFIAEPEHHREKAFEILQKYFYKECNQQENNNDDDVNFVEHQTDLLSLTRNYNYLRKSSTEEDIVTNDIVTNDIVTNDFYSTSMCMDVEETPCSDKLHQNEDSSSQTQNTTLLSDVVKNPNSSNRSLYSVFYLDKCKALEKTSIRRNRSWSWGFGANQYQIDAGQREFGAKQCKLCGLIYGANEPEEEKLHHEFHSSLHVLRFKGWIDEDCVANYTEWGREGRIIRITDSAHPKRRERLHEILKIVDKELGFSSYIIPNTFVAYFAVRNCQIVGFCLVQPLQKANKFVNIDGIDCCTIEEFEAKCGISRIWVSPLHRRLNIGKKLIHAVRVNTIIGEEIAIDKIAFSAPTADGKFFAQKVTATENFLVYQ